MVKKNISIYGEMEVHSPFSNDQLVIDVSDTHMAIMVKMAGRSQVGAFELFEFDSSANDWYDVFYQVRTLSSILERSFNDTRLFFHSNEVVLLPADKFTTSSGETYMAALHGDNTHHVMKYDNVNIEPPIANVFRISKSLNEMVNSNLIMVTARHIYSSLIENLLSPHDKITGTFLKVIFYYNRMIVVAINKSMLQLVQSYCFQSPDDMLYYLLSIVQQFNLPVEETKVELSGIVDAKSHYVEYIKKIFSHVSFESVPMEGSVKAQAHLYPTHYFSPFMNLVV
ncbi:MAG: DUF3822 family protein [Bacteroidota bacterium]|nr:DUF3822 family protein [Bacteroidota bacterium]